MGEKPHICSVCKFAFAGTNALKKHTEAIHRDGRGYSCPECWPTSFTTQGNLETHIKTQHRRNTATDVAIDSASGSVASENFAFGRGSTGGSTEH